MASNLRLLVRQQARTISYNIADGYNSVWMRFLKPFSPALWLCILGISALAAWAFAFLEGPSNNPDNPMHAPKKAEQDDRAPQDRPPASGPGENVYETAWVDDADDARLLQVQRLQ